MKECRNKSGLTIMEIITVVAILALLAAGLFFVSTKAASQAKAQLVQSTVTLLDTALQQYYQETGKYPPDVNYAAAGPARSLQLAISPTGGAVAPFMNPGGAYVIDYYDAQSIEVLYYYLNRLPQSRAVLTRLDTKTVTSKAVKLVSGYPAASSSSDPNLFIRVNGQDVSLIRVVDAWNMPLQYVRLRVPPNMNVETTNFPLIRSAGPDRRFGTDADPGDDIVNKSSKF